jgi:ABC-type transport system involved in cytochrome bd biosynthesis fused ATPase/permease subunit
MLLGSTGGSGWRWNVAPFIATVITVVDLWRRRYVLVLLIRHGRLLTVRGLSVVRSFAHIDVHGAAVDADVSTTAAVVANVLSMLLAVARVIHFFAAIACGVALTSIVTGTAIVTNDRTIAVVIVVVAIAISALV